MTADSPSSPDPARRPVLLFYSLSDDPDPWRAAITGALPWIDFRVWPDAGDPGEVDYTLVWKPPAGWHRPFRNLQAILSLGAGVDSLLEDPGLPEGVPVTRMVDAGMGPQMAQYAAYGVLHFHRQMHEYARMQREAHWEQLPPVPVREFPVGVMGLGVLGAQAARLLLALGYPVHGWSRSGSRLPGIRSHAGAGGLRGFLGEVRALVNFLPLTPETRGILDAALLSQLPRGAFVVNLARGGHLVESDLLAALDSGQIGGAMLDVFEEEPLPVKHPLWRHPRVVVTPHIAAAAIADDAAGQVIANLERLRRGEPLVGVVDPARGY